jgi:galactose-3-O-sulfotransferase
LGTGSHPLLALIHIPKTGGSSLVKAIRREYGESFGKSRAPTHGVSRPIKRANAIVDPVLAEAKLRALGEAADGSRPPVVAGHIVFGMRDLLPPDTRYLTVLREPVERALSHYAYLVEPLGPRSRPRGLLARGTPYRPEMTLEECLDDPRYLPDNLQTRMIVSRRSPFEPLPADALEQAKDHLAKRFAHVGVTDQLDELTALLTTAYGWSLALPVRTLVSQGRARRSDLAPATLRAIERSNMLDAELYEFACGLFERAVEEDASEVRLQLDILHRAAEREGGAAPATPPRGDLRARLVDARAELVIREAKIARLRHKLVRAKTKIQAELEPAEGAPPACTPPPRSGIASGEQP